MHEKKVKGILSAQNGMNIVKRTSETHGILCDGFYSIQSRKLLHEDLEEENAYYIWKL